MEESNKIETDIYNKVKRQKDLAILLCVIMSLICCVLGYILISLNPNFSKDSFWQIISYTLLSFIPICFVYIINYFLVTRDKEEYSKYETKEIFHPINRKMDELLGKISLKSKGLEKVMYSSEEPQWNLLLNDAESLDLCLFFINKDWIDKYESFFREFVNKGGVLNVYLPNPKDVKSRYFSKSEIKPQIQEEIISSFLFFKNLSHKKNNNIKLMQINQGLNYVLAKIEYPKKTLYYMSPYSNTSSEGIVPKFLFNNTLPEELNNFFIKEMDFLKKNSEEFVDVEKKQYFIFKKDRNTVYLSTGLVCNSSCVFCYSDSLINHHRSHVYEPLYIASILCKMIEDERIEKGVNGATIMIGGYNDPFHDDHFESTLLILKTLSKYQNPIHIATRHDLSEDQIQKLPVMKNLVINYSISSFPKETTDDLIEPSNQKDRFQTADSLIKKGFNVALFIRPVIKDITVRDLDTILEYIEMTGIEVVTVGGLYFDDRIEKSLNMKNITIDKTDVENKQFVLSVEKNNSLKKTCNQEVSLVIKKIDEYVKKRKLSLKVYKNAKDRVVHFKTFQKKKSKKK